jgi:hypothetical protein
MRIFITHSIRFILFALTQALIFNQIEVKFGVQVMIYPLFILLLPYSINIFLLMFLSFSLGLFIDSISNTYGLHASSAVLIAYLRPILFKTFEPRDGYDNIEETNIYRMEATWWLYVFGLITLIHHLWFFTLEIFKFNEIWFILQKTFLSVPITLLVCILIQVIFIRKPDKV